MEMSKSYDDIVLLEVGINNRSGGYKVKYDFEKNLITWRDSYMWNNNFMKHMNQSKIDILRNKLPQTEMLEWLVGYMNDEKDKYGSTTANPSTWEITVVFEDGTKLNHVSTQHFPAKWNSLKLVIEETTSCTFRLH